MLRRERDPSILTEDIEMAIQPLTLCSGLAACAAKGRLVADYERAKARIEQLEREKEQLVVACHVLQAQVAELKRDRG